MARISPALRMSEAEIDALLSVEKHMRIATIGPDSRINLTPMTFGWANGAIYTFARGQKVANLRRDGTATVLVDVGEAWRELKGVMLQGSARVLETAADEQADEGLAAAQMNLGSKHGLTEAGRAVPYAPSAAGKSRRWIVFQPERIVSWDNARLSGAD